MTSRDVSIAAYRVLLHLYPPRFRRRFGASMAADFADAVEDARSDGLLSLAAHWRRAGIDLARSVVLQWSRRPGPWLALGAAAWAAMSLNSVAFLVPAAPFDLHPAAGTENELLFVLITLATLFPVLAVMLFSRIFLAPLLRRRPGRRRA